MNKRNLSLFIALIACIYLIGIGPIERILSWSLSLCARPALRGVNLLKNSFVAPFQRFLETEELHKQVQVLEREREELLQELIAARASTWYLERTADLVSFYDRYHYDPALCSQILLKILTPHAQWALVDRGTRDGVKVGMIAVFKNMLVGKIFEVYPHVSKLLFITDPKCTIAVSGVESKASGIHSGSGNVETTRITYVSALAPLKVHELIISNGTGSLFPAGYALGTVTEVESDELYQKAVIKPVLNLKTLNYCYLLDRSAEPALGIIHTSQIKPDSVITNL